MGSLNTVDLISRPSANLAALPRHAIRLLLTPVLLLTCIGIIELVGTSPGDWLAMWLGILFATSLGALLGPLLLSWQFSACRNRWRKGCEIEEPIRQNL